MDCSGVAQIGMVDLAAFNAILYQHMGQFPRKLNVATVYI